MSYLLAYYLGLHPTYLRSKNFVDVQVSKVNHDHHQEGRASLVTSDESTPALKARRRRI